MRSGLQENSVARRPAVELGRWMERYQQADSDAPAVLITALSPALLCFFRSQPANRERADDLLQDTWLRIHRVRHNYRPGVPVLPWVFAIRPACGCGRLPQDAADQRPRDLNGSAAGATRARYPPEQAPGVRRTGCRPAPCTTGSHHDVEGRRTQFGRGSSRHIVDSRGRETEGAPCLRASAQLTPYPCRGSRGGRVQ